MVRRKMIQKQKMTRYYCHKKQSFNNYEKFNVRKTTTSFKQVFSIFPVYISCDIWYNKK